MSREDRDGFMFSPIYLEKLSSRQNIIKEETLAWIDRHYSGIFRDVHFGNHFALEGESRRKSEICR